MVSILWRLRKGPYKSFSIDFAKIFFLQLFGLLAYVDVPRHQLEFRPVFRWPTKGICYANLARTQRVFIVVENEVFEGCHHEKLDSLETQPVYSGFVK